MNNILFLDLRRSRTKRGRTSPTFMLISQTSLWTRTMSSVTLETSKIFSPGSSGRWRHCQSTSAGRASTGQRYGGRLKISAGRLFSLLTRRCKRLLGLPIGKLDETLVCAHVSSHQVLTPGANIISPGRPTVASSCLDLISSSTPSCSLGSWRSTLIQYLPEIYLILG